jgi:hypothetical protein
MCGFRIYTIIFYRLRERERARYLRHPTPIPNQRPESDHISTALLAGGEVAQQVGKYLKRQADQLFFEFSYPVTNHSKHLLYSLFQTSTYPTMSASSSIDSFRASERRKKPDDSLQASKANDVITCSNSTPSIVLPRCFGDDFADSFPFIDDFVSEFEEKTPVKSTSCDQMDEQLFRDLIRSYNPPFALKVTPIGNNSSFCLDESSKEQRYNG